MPDAPEPRGKFLYDMVVAQLAGQAADVASLTGRAKDLIGVATVSTTITGALANSYVVNFSKASRASPLALALLVVGFVTVFAAGFFVLSPRSWQFAPDAERVALESVRAHPNWPIDALYAQVAMGFLGKSVVQEGKTAVQLNAEHITLIRRCIQIQLIGLCALAMAGFILAAHTV